MSAATRVSILTSSLHFEFATDVSSKITSMPTSWTHWPGEFTRTWLASATHPEGSGPLWMDEISHLDDRQTLRHDAMQIGPERRQCLREAIRVTLYVADQRESSDFGVSRQVSSLR